MPKGPRGEKRAADVVGNAVLIKRGPCKKKTADVGSD